MIAFIIDFIIASVPVWLLFMSLRVGLQRDVLWFFPTVAGAIQVMYCAIFEYLKRQTIGKMAMGLRVEALMGGLSLYEAMIRNLSKIHGLLIILDTLVGFATKGDPRQRYLDRVAETTVISSSEPIHLDAYIRDHLNIFHRDTTGVNLSLICEECGGDLEHTDGDNISCTRCGRTF